MAEELGSDVSVPPKLHLVSAFLAMEPVDSLLSMTGELGRGLVTETAQRFIWDHCISKAQEMDHFHVPYLKNFLKKLISEVESRQVEVLDEFYELYAHYMVSWKDENLGKENARISKFISFLFPDGPSSCQKLRKFVVPLQCSLNMLEGVQSGLQVFQQHMEVGIRTFDILVENIYLNQLSYAQVGSGVGLVGICLAQVKTSKIVLSDGDLSALTNMKVNLGLNGLCCLSSATSTPERISDDLKTVSAKRTSDDMKTVECIHLPWESASESELQAFAPDIVLGADVIYDPVCLPHLVRVLSILLRPKKIDSSTPKLNEDGIASFGLRDRPVAYIASVIRNIDTFNHFLGLVEHANLNICDVTDELKPLILLPYMYSYDRSSIKLFTLNFK